MCCNCLLFWQQVICFKSLNLEQVTSKYSERLYLCLNNYHLNLKWKFNHLFHSLNVIESTIGCQYISVALYLLQTYPSGKPLFKGQGSVKFTYSVGQDTADESTKLGNIGFSMECFWLANWAVYHQMQAFQGFP